ncbi:MAG: XdhC family protein [Anaerolineaceae bacterium]|nr:XdhC family protein [Anaerolineaceae bacterium]
MQIYELINKAIKEHKNLVLCTVVETNGSVPRHAGSKMVVFDGGSREGTVGGGEVEERAIQEAKKALIDGQPRLVDYSLISSDKELDGLCGGNVKIYIEPIVQAPKLIIYGAGHVGSALARLAKWLSFNVIVSDDRSDLCDDTLIPDADEFLPLMMADTPDHVKIDSNTFIAVVTRGADVDIQGLPRLLESEAAYIGVMGSKRRWEFTRKGLIDAGVTEDKIARIKSPIGLSILAETPDEIAVSIMAEIIKLRNDLS